MAQINGGNFRLTYKSPNGCELRDYNTSVERCIATGIAMELRGYTIVAIWNGSKKLASWVRG